MAKKSKDYWTQRFLAMEDSQYTKSSVYYKQLQEQFRRVQNDIQLDIERWYQRLAQNNGVSLASARRLLKTNELEEFHWNVSQYIKYGQDNAISQRWIKELENASAKFHISYLDAMKLQTQQHAEKLFTEYEGGITDFLNKTFSNNYYRTGYEIAKGTGIGSNLVSIDTRKIDTLIKRPWAADGANFSDRIWTNKQKLVSNLNTVLTQSIIRGSNPDQAIINLAREMNVSIGQASRLIMTESAAITSKAQQECFKELGIEKYEIVATLDNKTSDICQELDGKVFKLSEYEIGVTAPPFHVNCRSTTVPYFDDAYTGIEQRAARNGDEETYYIPANVKYPEWKGTMVTDDTKRLLQMPKINDDRLKSANSTFSETLSLSEDTTHSNRMIMYNGAIEYEINEKLGSPFAYSEELDKIQYNPLAPDYNLYDMNYVLAHELSHRMDILEYMSWENQGFKDAVAKSEDILDNNSRRIAAWFSEGGKYEYSFAISDIISALGHNKIEVAIGHSNDYWSDERNIYLELFANISSMEVLKDEALADFKEMFQDLYGAFKEVVK